MRTLLFTEISFSSGAGWLACSAGESSVGEGRAAERAESTRKTPPTMMTTRVLLAPTTRSSIAVGKGKAFANDSTPRGATRVVTTAAPTSTASRAKITISGGALALALAFTPPALAALDPYGGVGLEIYVGPDRLPAIVEFLPTKTTGPAHDAGLRLNDKILEVNGVAATELGGLQGVAKALRGEAGTDVDVTVGRGRGRAPLAVEEVRMKREEIAPNPRSCFVASCARV